MPVGGHGGPVDSHGTPDDDLKIKKIINWDHLRPIIFGRGIFQILAANVYIFIYMVVFGRFLPQQNSAWSLGWVNTISWPLEIPEIVIPRQTIGSSDDLVPRLVRHQPRRNRLVGYPQQLVSVGLVDRFTEKTWVTKNVSTSKPYHKLLARLLNKNRSPKWVEEVMRFTYLTTVSGWITPDFLSYLSSMVNEVVVMWSWLGIQHLRASLRGEKIMMEWHSHNSHISWWWFQPMF